MSVQATAWAWEVDAPSGASQFVLVALANFAGEHGESFPAHRTIAKMTRQSVPTVRRAIADLAAAGLIAIRPRTRENGAQTSNEIILLHSEKARRYAQDAGLAIAQSEGTEDELDCVSEGPPPQDVGGGPDHNDQGGCSIRSGAVITSDQGGCSLVITPYIEPSLEPSGESLSSPQPVSLADPPGPVEREISFEDFEKVWRWREDEIRMQAKGAFLRLDRDARKIAVEAAPAYFAALDRLGRTMPVMARTWLNDGGWRHVRKEAPSAQPVWIEDGTQQARAWQAWRIRLGLCPEPVSAAPAKAGPGKRPGFWASAEWPPKPKAFAKPASAPQEPLKEEMPGVV